MPDEVRPHIDVALVQRLLREQFPQYADRAVRPVDVDGNDNRSFRVGDDLSARLPSATGYEVQVEKEAILLPRIADGVSLPVPVVVGMGAPGEGYPFRWSLRRWIDGDLLRDAVVDAKRLPADIARFLRELWAIDPTGGPEPGPATFGRGGPLPQWDRDIEKFTTLLEHRIDAPAIRAEWEAAAHTGWRDAPRWFHGDVANTNLLVDDRRLCAVLDFGCAGVGDPACDLMIAWSDFDDAQRTVFRNELDADDALWARGRAWALWKALISVGQERWDAWARRTLAELGHPLAA